MELTLQAMAALLGGVYNALITYESLIGQKKWWRIIASGITTIALLGFAGFKFAQIGN